MTLAVDTETRLDFITRLSQGENKAAVAIDILKGEALSAGHRTTLRALASQHDSALPVTEVLSTSARRSLPDNRQNFQPHPVISFSVDLSQEKGLNEFFKFCLGSDGADRLMRDWGSKITDCFPQKVRGGDITLFINSNNKSPNRSCLDSESAARLVTTVEEDFYATNHKYASELDLSIVCAAVFKKGLDAGLDLTRPASTWEKDQKAVLEQLTLDEIALLVKLCEGALRTQSESFYIYISSGRLRAYGCEDRQIANIYAAGAPKTS